MNFPEAVALAAASPADTGNASSPLRELERTVEPLHLGKGLPPWWEPLFEAAENAAVFMSPAWMGAWLDIFGADFDGAWVQWKHRGEVVGGCLLVSRVRWLQGLPVRTIYLNATGEASQRTPMAEYNDVLCKAGFQREIAADFARVLEMQRWACAQLSGYSTSAVIASAAGRLRSCAMDDEVRVARWVDFTASPGIPFEQSLTGKVGSHIRRNRRLFEERGGAPVLERAASLEEALVFHEALARLHTSRWESKGQAGSFSTPALVSFHRRIIARLWASGGVDLVRVVQEGIPCGYLYNFIDRGRVLVFQTAFAYEEGSSLSPGLFTHTVCIEHYRQRGLREYDLLAGDALYKRSLARNGRDLRWTTLYRDSLWGRLLVAARQAKRRIAARRRPRSESAAAPGRESVAGE